MSEHRNRPEHDYKQLRGRIIRAAKLLRCRRIKSTYIRPLYMRRRRPETALAGEL